MHVIGRQLVCVRTNQTAGMKGQSPRPRLVRRGSDGRQSLRRQRFPLERNTPGKRRVTEKRTFGKSSTLGFHRFVLQHITTLDSILDITQLCYTSHDEDEDLLYLEALLSFKTSSYFSVDKERERERDNETNR